MNNTRRGYYFKCLVLTLFATFFLTVFVCSIRYYHEYRDRKYYESCLENMNNDPLPDSFGELLVKYKLTKDNILSLNDDPVAVLKGASVTYSIGGTKYYRDLYFVYEDRFDSLNKAVWSDEIVMNAKIARISPQYLLK